MNINHKIIQLILEVDLLINLIQELIIYQFMVNHSQNI